MVKTQTLATPNADEDEEQQELSFTNGENTEWYRWWECIKVQMVGIQKGTDGGNKEWYTWWEYGMVQMWEYRKV